MREIWAALEADERSAPPGLLVRRIIGQRDMRLGIDKPSGNRLFVLTVASETISGPLPELAESAGFSVRAVRDTSTSRMAIQLVLGHSRFKDIFVVLVEDVVSRIGQLGTDDAAMKELLLRLARWQEFLRLHGAEGLAHEAQRGLYGELWILDSKLISLLGSVEAVNSWTGPQGSPQDFQLPGRAIEVKVSTTKQHQSLKISNERQLSTVGAEHLLLLHLSLDVRDGGMTTLPALVASVRTQLEPNEGAAARFEEKLLRAGYLDSHAPLYAKASYTFRSSNYFRVVEGFPRITEAMIPMGTGDVTYSVSVAACMPYVLTTSDATKIIAGEA